MVINTKVTIEGTEYSDIRNIKVKRSIGEFNSTSSFELEFDNPAGRHNTDFSLNDEVLIYADKDASPTTKIFSGLIEDIDFRGRDNTEKLKITGRDFGVQLRDIIVESRIFSNAEVSTIVTDLMNQNVPNITVTNVDVTGTTPTKITFNNESVFDALNRLAQLADFIFYVDENQDLHFEQREGISSGLTFDNSNTLTANFRTSDSNIFNNVKVVGDRQLTGANEVFTAGAGSSYILDNKPFNTVVTLSGPTNSFLQPGGVLNLSDPSTENTKYLVNFQGQEIIITSGTTAGDNRVTAGSVIIVDYQRSTPLISIRQDSASIGMFGRKDKTIIDKNIKDINEASETAANFLSEHKDQRVMGTILVKGIIDVTPGNTAIVDFPFEGINTQTYQILNLTYDFNIHNNLNESILTVSLNKKISNFIDTTKETILRLRKLEGAETDANITNLEAVTDSMGVVGSAVCVSRSIGSAFYFHTVGPGGRHDLFESPKSLLGDMRLGSIVHPLQ